MLWVIQICFCFRSDSSCLSQPLSKRDNEKREIWKDGTHFWGGKLYYYLDYLYYYYYYLYYSVLFSCTPGAKPEAHRRAHSNLCQRRSLEGHLLGITPGFTAEGLDSRPCSAVPKLCIMAGHWPSLGLHTLSVKGLWYPWLRRVFLGFMCSGDTEMPAGWNELQGEVPTHCNSQHSIYLGLLHVHLLSGLTCKRKKCISSVLTTRGTCNYYSRTHVTAGPKAQKGPFLPMRLWSHVYICIILTYIIYLSPLGSEKTSAPACSYLSVWENFITALSSFFRTTQSIRLQLWH